MSKRNPLGKKISDVDYRFGGNPVRMRVHVTSDGKFNIPIPEFAVPVLGFDMVSRDTKEAAVYAWEGAGREYSDRLTDKEKVIVYNMQVTATVWDEAHEKVIFRKDDVSFAKGTALSLYYLVCYRHSRPDKETVSYHFENGSLAISSRRHNDENYIPWTAEAEAFFKECRHRLEVLAMGLDKFLNEQEPKLVAERISEAIGLLDFKGDEKNG